jgi:hypothetical protein
MSKQASVLKKHEEVVALREILECIGKDYRDVARLYMEYQRLREKLGKPRKNIL